MYTYVPTHPISTTPAIIQCAYSARRDSAVTYVCPTISSRIYITSSKLKVAIPSIRPSSRPHDHIPNKLRCILGELHLDRIHVPRQQRAPIQPRTSDHVVGIALVPLLLLFEFRHIAIPLDAPGRFVAVDDLREDADALEGIPVAAHDPDGDVGRAHFVDGGLRQEHLLGAALGERVRVHANAAADAVDDAGGVGEAGHVGDVLVVDPAFRRRDGGVVVDDEEMPVGRVGGDAAVAQPEEIPVVAVGRMWGVAVVFAVVEDELAALGELLELGLEGDVPVRVVFEDDGGGDAFADYTLCEVEVRAPGA